MRSRNKFLETSSRGAWEGKANPDRLTWRNMNRPPVLAGQECRSCRIERLGRRGIEAGVDRANCRDIAKVLDGEDDTRAVTRVYSDRLACRENRRQINERGADTSTAVAVTATAGAVFMPSS